MGSNREFKREKQSSPTNPAWFLQSSPSQLMAASSCGCPGFIPAVWLGLLSVSHSLHAYHQLTLSPLKSATTPSLSTSPGPRPPPPCAHMDYCKNSSLISLLFAFALGSLFSRQQPDWPSPQSSPVTSHLIQNKTKCPHKLSPVFPCPLAVSAPVILDTSLFFEDDTPTQRFCDCCFFYLGGSLFRYHMAYSLQFLQVFFFKHVKLAINSTYFNINETFFN